MKNYLFDRLPTAGIILVAWSVFLFYNGGNNPWLPLIMGASFLLIFFGLKNSKYAGIIDFPMSKRVDTLYVVAIALMAVSIIGSISKALPEIVNMITALGCVIAGLSAYAFSVAEFMKSKEGE